MIDLKKYVKILPTEKEKADRKVKNYDENIVCKDFILIFDIDECLYSSEASTNAEIEFCKKVEKSLIDEYFSNNSESAIKPMTYTEMRAEYGSPADGILTFYKKPMDFFVQNSFYDAHNYIEKDDKLGDVLNSLPYDKYCFTNGLMRRCSKILEKLEIEDQFKAVFCPNEHIQPGMLRIAKPKPEAYRFVEKYLNIGKDTKIVFFDDNIANVATALSEDFQWITYHVTKDNNIYSRIQQFKDEYMMPYISSKMLDKEKVGI